jgi:hypothetical protein
MLIIPAPPVPYAAKTEPALAQPRHLVVPPRESAQPPRRPHHQTARNRDAKLPVKPRLDAAGWLRLVPGLWCVIDLLRLGDYVSQ